MPRNLNKEEPVEQRARNLVAAALRFAEALAESGEGDDFCEEVHESFAPFEFLEGK